MYIFFITIILSKKITKDIDSQFEDLNLSGEEQDLKLKEELVSSLHRIDQTVEMTLSGIDMQTVRLAWKEGRSIRRDLQFESDLMFYKTRELTEAPCKTIDFLFNIKQNFEIYEFNCKKYISCFLKFYDLEIKDILQEIILDGINDILKSGYNNPISTFFSNLLIIEGPLKLKRETFASLYQYIDKNTDFNETISGLMDLIIKNTYIIDNKDLEEEEIEKIEEDKDLYLKQKSTTITFFLYDIIIIYNKNKDIYLSSYDFIQPDSQMINNEKTMDPKYVSQNYKEALEKDLEKFKQLKSDYDETGTTTIYHKAYYKYLSKNIQILCKFFYNRDECQFNYKSYI